MKAIEEAGLTDEEEIKQFLDERKNNKTKTNGAEQYILDSFPLKQNRYGTVSKSLETFFKISNQECGNNKQKPCLLRKGIEEYNTKTFLGCLSVLFLKSKQPTIENMIQHIKDKVTLDNILRFHGGNIPSLFYNEKELDHIHIDDYKDTKIYKKYTIQPDRNERQLKIIINGYENFLKYIEDKREYVDYYYLWDMISCGLLNEHSRDHPLNMFIIKENNNKDISILCPTPGFSRHYYDINQKTILIYHKDKYFEPILLQNKTNEKKKSNQKIKYDCFFDTKNAPFLKSVFEKLKNDISIQCSIQEPIHKDINVFELMNNHKQTLKTKYKFIRQIIHVNNKVFGVELSSKKLKQTFILPCNYSSIYDPKELDYDFYDETIWKDYDVTKKCLNMLHDTMPQLKCKPIKRIINDTMIIGILTLSNHFVKVIPMLNTSINDELIEEKGYDTFEIDYDLFHHQYLRENKRQSQIHALQLEKQFYNAFLNTIRYQLQQYENNDIRKKIQTII